MKNARTLCAVSLVAVALFAAAACADDRDGFAAAPIFEIEAGGDAPVCGYQCSLDGRNVIDTCTGEVAEKCASELACGGGRCQAPCAAAAADGRSDGCEFYFQTPRFKKNLIQSCLAVYVVNTSLQPVEISLELDGAALDVSKSVYRTNPGDAKLIPHEGALPPGESAILFVSDAPPDQSPPGLKAPCPKEVTPASYSDALPDGTGFGTAFHLTTNLPVAVTSMYPFGGAVSYFPSATLLLPVATWSKQHILVNGWEAATSGDPGAQIIAAEDDTEVTILPKRDTQDGDGFIGGPAFSVRTYPLRKGQILQLVQNEELSGSIVTSTKPTTIFGGHSCAKLPITGAACDILNQEIPGFERWGSEYVAVGYRPRTGNESEPVGYRIVAARDGTVLDYDPAPPPGAPLTMSAGEVAMFTHGTGEPFVVRTQDADHAIYVAAYMSGYLQGFAGPSGGESYYAGQGDPEFVNVVPAGQYLNSYSFYADPTYPETSLVIVRAKAAGQFKDVWLECAGNLTGFRPIGTRGEYEWARVELARAGKPGDSFDGGVCQTGLHRMRSEGAFTATLWGWGFAASYAYPGGMAQRSLVASPLPPLR